MKGGGNVDGIQEVLWIDLIPRVVKAMQGAPMIHLHATWPKSRRPRGVPIHHRRRQGGPFTSDERLDALRASFLVLLAACLTLSGA